MMKRHVAACTALALLLTSAPAMAEPLSVTFGNEAIGTSPRDFQAGLTGSGEPGQWEVVEDASARGNRALAQLSPDSTNNRFPLAIYGPLSVTDVDVVVRFKPISGAVDQAGGVVVRLADEDNYYIARANSLEDNVRFYRVENGQRKQIEGAGAEVAPGTWHTLGLRAEGNKFTVSFDGRVLFVAEDGTFTGPGKIGLWTKADSVTHFDELEITELN